MLVLAFMPRVAGISTDVLIVDKMKLGKRKR